ncbi:hypothetical protein B0T18DRAFT_12145 [Schizothecium vesticola]|uniref:Uncharacterized protein n=1 Tax=Schizothecium vesticola TaxID=314040 RepID=A0AA40F963_9PEZI|nr:hypothetical protein B0T18DRAFT_12145 [Schizothecium vesticola]
MIQTQMVKEMGSSDERKMTSMEKKRKTYSTRDSLVVTDPTTSLAITDLMYGNKGVLKKQLWSQETGASDHRNGSASLRFLEASARFKQKRPFYQATLIGVSPTSAP